MKSAQPSRKTGLFLWEASGRSPEKSLPVSKIPDMVGMYLPEDFS